MRDQSGYHTSERVGRQSQSRDEHEIIISLYVSSKQIQFEGVIERTRGATRKTLQVSRGRIHCPRGNSLQPLI